MNNFLYSFFFCVASVLGILHNLKEKVSVAFNPALRNNNPPSWTGQCSISPPGSTSRWPSGTLSSTWSGCVSAVAHCCPLATARLNSKGKTGSRVFLAQSAQRWSGLGQDPLGPHLTPLATFTCDSRWCDRGGRVLWPRGKACETCSAP